MLLNCYCVSLDDAIYATLKAQVAEGQQYTQEQALLKTMGHRTGAFDDGIKDYAQDWASSKDEIWTRSIGAGKLAVGTVGAVNSAAAAAAFTATTPITTVLGVAGATGLGALSVASGAYAVEGAEQMTGLYLPTEGTKVQASFAVPTSSYAADKTLDVAKEVFTAGALKGASIIGAAALKTEAGKKVVAKVAEKVQGGQASKELRSLKPEDMQLKTHSKDGVAYKEVYVGNSKKATLAEVRAAGALKRSGFMELPSKLPGGQGIDSVWVKHNAKGEVEKIIIVESKYAADGKAKLNKNSNLTRAMDKRFGVYLA